jgi:hypothetical protein
MLSAEKHLCSSSKATTEILRFAQDDTDLVFPRLRNKSGCGSEVKIVVENGSGPVVPTVGGFD